MRTSLITITVSSLILMGCTDDASPPQVAAAASTVSPAQTFVPSNQTELNTAGEFLSAYINESGLDTVSFSTDVRPQDDFFDYVNANWLDRTQIPADRTRWGVMSQLNALNEERQRAIIEEMSARTDLGENAVGRKVGAFYASLTNRELVQGKGNAPIADALKSIDAIGSYDELATYFGASNIKGGASPVGVGVLPDPGDSDTSIAYLWQTGLALPDRDYYLKDEAKFNELREAYPSYIGELLALAGYAGDEQTAADVLKLETDIARGHWEAVRNRDMKALYNMVPVSALNERAPGFNWANYLRAAGIDDQTDIMAAQIDYVETLGKLVNTFSLEQWKSYLRFHLLNASATWLDDAYRDAHFAFMGAKVSGQQEQSPDWKKAVRTINDLMGEAVGMVYVDQYFPDAYKTRMNELVDHLMETFRVGIQELDWMSDETKQKAESKRLALVNKIGFPDVWKVYDDLTISESDPLGNVQRASEFEYRRDLAKLGKPIDRTEWSMTPQTINAYHNPFLNEIVFPAGILQPPMFNMEADDAVNYGAIGMVIGHEIGHAFDDKGRHFDSRGKLSEWWTEEDAEKFEAAAGRLVDQYAAYEPIEGMRINGSLTLGENIADLTGLTIAWRAYHAALGDAEAPMINGLTGDQRFFLGFAQSWREKAREERLREQLVSDPHSPARYRVNGVLPNFDPFYDTFGVTPDDGMYIPPDQRVKIW